MKGAVAAGHPQSARAGARMLERGGNAVDACVAAAFAAAVCESPLTGLGAGGFMLVHRARDHSTRVADFFVAAPGLGATRGRRGPMIEIDVGFGDSATTQPFRIGAASVAVSGYVTGLEAVHRAYGRLAWRELVVPACELARDGVRLTRAQGHIHAILDPIIRGFDEGRRVYSGPDGGRLGTGDLLRLPDLAATLERVGAGGAASLSRGRLARQTVAAVREGGGELTLADLAAYRVVWRRPVAVAYAGHTVASNPPPSSGGVLLAYGLALIAQQPTAARGSAEALVALAEVMREQSRARGRGFSRGLQRGGLAGRLLAPSSLEAARRRIEARSAPVPVGAAAPGGTTHVSVVDGEGNAASLSSSTGSGSGVIVPGTGIYLNNMLGEDDLVGVRAPRPGGRLTSMMAPTLALSGGGPRLVVGSAGSARLRGAIMQVVVNVLAHHLGVTEAIEAPRIHVEEPLVHCEGGHDADAVARLVELGYDVVGWKARNLFFGGASAVAMTRSGTLSAAGDPRRGGAGVVVE